MLQEAPNKAPEHIAKLFAVALAATPAGQAFADTDVAEPLTQNPHPITTIEVEPITKGMCLPLADMSERLQADEFVPLMSMKRESKIRVGQSQFMRGPTMTFGLVARNEGENWILLRMRENKTDEACAVDVGYSLEHLAMQDDFTIRVDHKPEHDDTYSMQVLPDIAASVCATELGDVLTNLSKAHKEEVWFAGVNEDDKRVFFTFSQPGQTEKAQRSWSAVVEGTELKGEGADAKCGTRIATAGKGFNMYPSGMVAAGYWHEYAAAGPRPGVGG